MITIEKAGAQRILITLYFVFSIFPFYIIMVNIWREKYRSVVRKAQVKWLKKVFMFALSREARCTSSHPFSAACHFW